MRRPLVPPAHARRTRILEIIDAQGFARVTDLADLMQVTEVTVRSDLDHLARSRAVRRVHGGAVRPGLRSVVDETPGLDGSQNCNYVPTEKLRQFMPCGQVLLRTLLDVKIGL
ncbi:MAG: DeoR family transcriptional regulator [Ornithinimicrobium sp.]|uniref:DeoR family transcriptional regulator n=1 Tax=Ornithinimicrobium sp. TaxID=1977084 RepID=UPI003D9B17E2